MKTSNQQDRELDGLRSLLYRLLGTRMVDDKGQPLHSEIDKVGKAIQSLYTHHLELETVKAREDSTKWALNRLLEIEKGIRTHDEVKEMFYESLAQLKASTEATKDTGE